MNGSEITSANSSDTVIVVVNGSPTPSVTGLSPIGRRGSFATSAFIAAISAGSCARACGETPLPGLSSACRAACVSPESFSRPCCASTA